MDKEPDYPARCPVTNRPFFSMMGTPEGEIVPTYGGPFDSYTIPERDDDGNLFNKRYDHDVGGWVEDETLWEVETDEDE